MPTWSFALLGTAVNIFFSFYFKWVPDVDDQKRHVRQAAWWALDIATIVCQVWPLYALSHVNGPVTPSLIIHGALCGAGLAFCSIMIFMRRTYGRLLSKQIENVGRLIEVHDKTFANQMETLQVLSKRVDLTAEVVQRLNSL